MLGCHSEQTPPGLASVVGSIQAAAAMLAPCGANLLGELLVNGKEPRTKLDIYPRLVRAGIASCLHTTEVRALGQLGSSFPRVSAFRPSANVTRIRALPINSRDQGHAMWTAPFDGLGKEPLGHTIKRAMDDASEIHFNLEGMSSESVADILRNPDPRKFKDGCTNWELATVLSNPDLKKKTHFWEGAYVKSGRCP
jgi:hypothetical protein